MQIAKVVQKRPSVWELQLIDGRCYEIDYDCVLKYALLDRLEIAESTLKEMQSAYCQRHALQQAMRWLQYRPYTYKGMFQRLLPQYGETVSFTVMARLTEMGLINDYQYAQQMAHSVIEHKQYGLRRAREILLQKGIPKNVIAAVLLPYEETISERLQQLIHRRYAEKLTNREDRKTIEKVKASLVRKGYGFSEVNAAIQQYWQEQMEKDIET